MRIKNILFATILSVISFSSCTTDDESSIIDTNRTTVRFTSTISGQVETRATGTSWTKDDAIGVFMKTSGSTLSSTSIIDRSENKKYTTIGSGNFSPTNVDQSIYYPTKGSKVDFIAYYPYNPNLTNYLYKVNVQDQNSEEAIDLLYSNNANGLSSGNPTSSLAFSHQLSKIVLNIKAGNGLSTLEGLTISISGMKTEAEFSLIDGTLSINPDSKSDISLKVTTSGTSASSQAIVLPSEGVSGRTISFTLPSGTFKWVIPSGVVYEKGYRYVYDIVLKNKGGEVNPNFGWAETPIISPLPNTTYLTNMLPDNAKVRNFSMLYDTEYKLAYWVAYPMHSSYLGDVSRTNAWGYDPGLSQTFQPLLSKGWGISGLDRGHQIPSGDRTSSRAANAATFYYSNMTAQNSTLNQVMWANLEDKVRTWTSQCDTLYVVTGAMITTQTDKTITYVKDNAKKDIAKPKYYYKVLAKKIGTTYYTIGFKMNNEVPLINNYNNHRIKVTDLEKETGFTFFPSLGDNVKNTINASMWL